MYHITGKDIGYCVQNLFKMECSARAKSDCAVHLGSFDVEKRLQKPLVSAQRQLRSYVMCEESKREHWDDETVKVISSIVRCV